MENRRLHIGCGEKYIPGFIHVDVRKFPHVDYVTSADKLDMFADNSVDLIYCSHVLEHFGRYEVDGVLQEWYRILRSGGILRLAVPDFESIVEVYQQYHDMELIMGLLYGGQNYEFDAHHVAFDFRYIKKLLSRTGFRNVRTYEWRRTIHKDFDDFSQAYIPHMDKDHGVLMSLNVEAEK